MNIKETLRRLSYLLRPRFHQELDDELRFHLESRIDELIAAGMPKPAATAQATREFGFIARVAEDSRSVWQFQRLRDLASDLHYAARGFRRNPAFAATAILCLALGTGANTTIFSVAAEVLFGQPSVKDGRNLVGVNINGNSHTAMKGFRFIRDSNLFTAVAGENENLETNWRHGDSTDRLFAVQVTGNYFDVTGFPLAVGRPIQPGDTNTVVISHRFWQSRLSGDPNVIGRPLTLDAKPYFISGVLPKDHRTLTGFGFAPDLYMPAANDPGAIAMYARLPAGMTRQVAIARMRAIGKQLDQLYPHEEWAEPPQITPTAGWDRIRWNRGLVALATFFAMLMIVVGLVLLIACANVASLLLARASSRTQEMAIRLSIGAGRGRIVRQLFAESLLLALCGTIAGLGLNLLLTSLVSRIQLPLPVPIQFLIRPNWTLFAYSIAIALATSLAAGLLPALKSARADLNVALKQNERQVAAGPWSLRNILVAGQLAVSIVLLSAAVLFVRNLLDAATRNPGFEVDHTAWAAMRLVPENYPTREKILPFVNTALDNLRTLPGVESATIARVVPLNDSINYMMNITTDAGTPPMRFRWQMNYVGSNYFDTMRIPILEGRAFQDHETAVILNQKMARRIFGNMNPIGHTIRVGDRKPKRVVGVARNSKYMTLAEDSAMAAYEPFAQEQNSSVNLHFLVRAAGPPQPVIPAIHAALNRLDPTAALEIKTMQQGLGMAMIPSRAGAIVLGAMGLLGLTLASIGLYGVLLFAVSRRIREIGLRVALGATPAEVLKLVIGQSAGLVGAGMAVGLTVAVFAVRPLAMFLSPEIHTGDPLTFILVAVALAAVAMIATIAPAAQALRIDPVVALRHD